MKKPQLLVREVDPDLVNELKKRAVANGRSAEAEHRKILEEALTRPRRIPLSEALLKIPNYGEYADFERRDEDGPTDAFS